MQLVRLNDPKRIAGVNRFHVVILPERGRRLLIPQEDEHLAPVGAFDVHVGRLVFPWRGVYIDAEGTFLVKLHHAEW
jgi:hypothetical protein